MKLRIKTGENYGSWSGKIVEVLEVRTNGAMRVKAIEKGEMLYNIGMGNIKDFLLLEDENAKSIQKLFKKTARKFL